jgi:hypothetical protein
VYGLRAPDVGAGRLHSLRLFHASDHLAAGWIVQNLPPGAERETRLRRLTRPTNSVEDDAVLQRNEASCRGASVLFLLLERVLLLVLVMLLNERHCVGDQHERREDDNDHIRSPRFDEYGAPRGHVTVRSDLLRGRMILER